MTINRLPKEVLVATVFLISTILRTTTMMVPICLLRRNLRKRKWRTMTLNREALF